MDSEFQLCNIQNLVVLANENAKQVFMETVYPHNIDCIVLTQQEAKHWTGNYKVVFFGCWVEELKDCENIIMDDMIFKTWSPKPHCIRWEPQSLAMFIACWFNQGKYRKTGNNMSWRFQEGKPNDGRFEWLRNLMM